MEWMDETSVYLINKTHSKNKTKQKKKRGNEAEANKPTQLEALCNQGWKQSIQCFKLVGLQ